MTDTTIDLGEIPSVLQEFRNLLGSGWIARNAQPRPGEDQHLLLGWLQRAERYLGHTLPSQDALQITHVVLAVRDLRASSVVNVEARIAALRNTNTEDSLATLHELITAASYLRRGHRVEFLDESGPSKNSDILIDDAVLLECKYKVRYSLTSIRRQRYYQVINRSLAHLVSDNPYLGGVRVECTFHTEPEAFDVRTLLVDAKNALLLRGNGNVSEDRSRRDLVMYLHPRRYQHQHNPSVLRRPRH